MFDIVLAFAPVVTLAIAAIARYGISIRRYASTRWILCGRTVTLADFRNAEQPTIIKRK